MDEQLRTLRGRQPEARAGAEEVAGGVAQLHLQPGPLGVLEEGREVEHLVPRATGHLGRHLQPEVRVFVTRHDGEGRLEHVNDRAQVAGGLGRVVWHDDGRLVEDHSDPVLVGHGDVDRPVAI